MEEVDYTMFTCYLNMIDAPQEKRQFEQIYLSYRQTMYFTAYQILHDSYEAEDAVHNALLRVILNMDKIDMADHYKTKAFLVILAENAAIDIYRKRKKANTVSYDELSESVICGETTDINEAIDINSLILNLPIQYEIVLRLKYSHGYTNSEISKILNISEANVRQRIARAKKKLSLLLEQEGEK